MNKNKHRPLLLWLLAVLVLCQPALVMAQSEPMSLPKSWYVLPEDQTSDDATLSEPDANTDMTKTLDFLVDSQLNALDGVTENDDFRDDESEFASKDQNWHLFAAAFDIGASASGLIGLLMLKGEALVNMYWNRMERPPKAPAPGQDATSDAPLGLTFSEPLTPVQLEQKLAPLVSAVMATGKVENRQRLTAELTEQAERFNALVEGIMDDPHTEWWPSRLRFDLAIAGSGQVYPGISVGGGLKIRFDWFPTPAFGDGATFAYSPQGEKLGRNFNKFLRTLGHELGRVEWDAFPTPKNMAVNQIHITLGLYGDFKIGIAKANAAVQGSVYFARRQTGFVPVDVYEPDFVASLDEHIGIIDVNAPVAHRDFAKAQGIAYERYQDAGGEERDVYKLPRDFLTKGLEKSTQIASFMADRASRRPSDHWFLNQIRAQFTLSLAGTAGVVTVGGSAAFQLIINRTSPPFTAKGGV